ncbi:MAG: hypothetical protein ABFR32_05420 [Bacteroidota bacterium]
MKKIFTFLLLGGLLIGFSNTTYAQEDYSALNIFVQFGNNSAINAHYEIPIAKNFTVSPAIVVPFSFDYINLGARADYYFDSLLKLPEPWDIWAGVDAGFVLGDDEVTGGFEINGHVGVEYKFNDTWGIIGEFGGGTVTFGGIGVGIHF